MSKDFKENEYSVPISWKFLNKIKYLQCTRSNFKSNAKQTALSNKPFTDSFLSSNNFCLENFLLFLMTLFYWYCNTDICTFGKLLANLKIPSQPIVPFPQWLGGKLECLSFVDGPRRQISIQILNGISEQFDQVDGVPGTTFGRNVKIPW